MSESPFRRLCRAYGADVVVSEFVSSEGIRRNDRRTHEYLRFEDEERPIGIQIFGADPQAMGEAAALVRAAHDRNPGCLHQFADPPAECEQVQDAAAAMIKARCAELWWTRPALRKILEESP